MKIDRFVKVGLVIGSMMLGSMGAYAYPGQYCPPPPGVVVPHGMTTCPRCQGYRRVPSGFLGLKDKRCPECKGAGFIHLRGYHHAPPPPPPKVHHHKPAPPPPPHAKRGPSHGKKVPHGKGPGKGHSGPKKPSRR